MKNNFIAGGCSFTFGHELSDDNKGKTPSKQSWGYQLMANTIKVSHDNYICVATPGAVEAVKQLDMVGKVGVTGLGVPSLIRPFLKDGSLKEAALWNPIDIGYGATYIAHAQVTGTLDKASGEVDAGRLGTLKFIGPDTVLLGEPYIFTKDNVDLFSF